MWSSIALEFKNMNENQVKNRFYSTLRRVATKKLLSEQYKTLRDTPLFKGDLVKYVDEAMKIGHNCFSKRGRKKGHTKSFEDIKKTQENCNVPNGVLPSLPLLPPLRAQPEYKFTPYAIPVQQPRLPMNPFHPMIRPMAPIMPNPMYTPMSMPMLAPSIYNLPQIQPTIGMQNRLEEVIAMQNNIIAVLLKNRFPAQSFGNSTTY